MKYDIEPTATINRPTNQPFFNRQAASSTQIVQPKLTVGASNDAHEREADQTADRVMRKSEGAMISPISSIQRKCDQCEKEEKVNRKETGATGGFTAPPSVSRAISRSGQALDSHAKTFMETRFNRKFDGVQVHTDGEAAASARDISARAYTSGNHIVFGQGQYQPNTEGGRHLLAHELTHVVQQNKNIQRQPQPQLGSQPALTQDERIELRRLTGDRISMAYTDFSTASQRVKASIKAAVAKENIFLWIIGDIALGLLLPGAGKLIAKIANNIPTSASNVSYRLAIAALDESRNATILKNALSGVKEYTKINVMSLYGESETDQYITRMNMIMRESFDKLNGELSKKSDEELGTLYVQYDPSITNEEVYAATINEWAKKLKQQVLQIGKKEHSSRSTGAYIFNNEEQIEEDSKIKLVGLYENDWVSNKKYYALVNIKNTTTTRNYSKNSVTQYKYVTYVDESMKSLAIKRSKLDSPNSPYIELYKFSEIENLPLIAAFIFERKASFWDNSDGLGILPR